MSEVRLGELAPEDADRDATHIAVVPMIANVDMDPGERCVMTSPGHASIKKTKVTSDYIGIVC